MKNEGKAWCKTLCLLITAFLIAHFSLLIISCQEPLMLEYIDIPQGYGSFSLRVTDNENGRTILPTAPSLNDYAVYNLAFTATSGGANVTVDRDNTTLTTEPVILVAGTYTLTVSAYLDTGKTRLAAQGTLANITITAGANASASVQLKALTNSGTGTFNWSVNISASGVTSAAMIISQNNTAIGSPVNLLTTTSGNPSLASGIYNVNFKLSRPNEEAEWNELLYIYSSLESNFTKTFDDQYFYRTHYNVTLNHNYNGISLPQSVLHGDTLALNTPERSGFDFIGWYTDESLSILYDFDTEIFNDFTLYADWEAAGTVTVSKDGGAPEFQLNLDAALASITTAGNYTITILTDQTLGARTLDTAGINITLVGSETGAANERTIKYNGAANDYMFLLKNGASLTLGNNVTLLGITGGSKSLLYVQNGTLTMDNGSKITGHTTSVEVIVAEGASSRFIMNGGIITDNATTLTSGSILSGGIFINANATATITGGSITGNSPVDIYIDSTSTFNLSGNAQVGNIRLNAPSAAANASITLDAFTGNAASVHLRSDTTIINNVISSWLNKQVIQAASGHTLTAEDIAKFPPGNFITSSTAVNQQPISNTHIFNNEAPDFGKLITIPRVTVNNGTTIANYDNLTAAFTAIGWATGNFTIKLYEDQTMTSSRELGTNQHILIIGAGGVRTINGSNIAAASNMFTVNGATLTLGENITIKGRTTTGTGAVINISNGTFRMLAGSKITGHVNNGTSAAVYLPGVGSVFEMLGGSIDNNTTTAAAGTTTTSGGVVVIQGTLIMTGGSITGNTQGTEPSDVYHVNTAANSFTISGNAAIGALKLNAGALANAYTKVTIGAGGWTGEITTLNLRGDIANVTTTVSYWASSTKTIFNDITAAEVAQIGLGEFISSGNARQAISPTYIIGTESANLGKLAVNLAIAPVTVTLNGETTGYINLAAACTDIVSQQAGDFTVTLKEDQTMTEGRSFNTAGQNITIVSNGGMRTINGSNIGANSTLFIINNATASLTLGENITIQGRTATAGEGAVVRISAGTFTMLGNSRIQGHNINAGVGASGGVFLAGGTFNMRDNSVITGISSSTAGSAAVYIANSNSTFNMQGGQITGNSNSTAITNTSLSGGVSLLTGIFNMTGGSITGNTQLGNASDVYHTNTAANSFTISGEAVIGELKLTATSNTVGASVTIGTGGWTGEITTLNLHGNIAAIATALGYWTGRTAPIFNDITAAQVARVGLGDFISSNNVRQAISPTYRIGTSGANLGRLIMDPDFAPVCVTVDGANTGYLNITTAFTAIGTQTGDFTVTLREDQTITAQRSINAAGQNIAIVGEGGIRTIFGNVPSVGDFHIFTISNAAASLTLGENITLQGRTQPSAGAAVNNTNGTFRMLSGSRITGHRTNATAGGTVQINGADARFIMEGGIIEGNNNNSSGTTTATGGVYFMNGAFSMTGGSITGNTQGGTEASDVYFGPTVAANYNTSSFEISGSANIGELRLNANSTSVGATVSIGAAGWTGEITTLNLRGNIIAIATALSYWAGRTAPIFNNITAAQVARIGLGEFISSINTRQAIGDTHYINASGVLTVLPDSAVVVNGVPFDNLTLALASTTAAGTYLIDVLVDQELAPQTLTGSGRNITIASPSGAEVQLSANGRLFTVNSGVTLTLGGGITLRGRSGNNAPLITNSGGTLIIDGATITGNQSTGEGTGVYGTSGSITMKSGTISFNTTTGGGGGGVTLNGNVTFRMEGGTITDNSSNAEGGGICGFNNPIVIMTGGIIQRNTAGTVSAGVFTNSGSFTKTGNSIITGWGDDQVNGNVVRDISGAVVSGANHAIRTSNMTSANTVGAGVNTP